MRELLPIPSYANKSEGCYSSIYYKFEPTISKKCYEILGVDFFDSWSRKLKDGFYWKCAYKLMLGAG